MKLATTTIDLHPFADTYEKRIELFLGTPFRYLDLGLYLNFLDDNYLEEAKKIRETADRCGFRFVQSHAADYFPFDPTKDQAEEILKKERAIECCALIGIPSVVIHPFRPYGDTDLYPEGRERFFEENRKGYELLYPAMERYGVQVLIENSAEANMKGRYFFMTGREMADFLDECHHPLLRAVWDIGHANLRGNNQYEDILALGSHLAALHIQDNDGQKDEHTAPFQGTVNMDAVMQGLLKIGYRGAFTFEANNLTLRSGGWPYKRRSFVGEFPNRLDNPSLELKLFSEKLLYETGRYILESYGVFEG